VWASPAVAPLGLTSATITLTSAQIKALHATPITIIPAQGVGTMIITVGITGQYTYGGSNVFVAAAGQFVSASYNTLQGIGTMLPNSALIAAASQDGIVGMPNISTLSVRNQPIVAYNSNATEISGNAANDNTLKITVLYYVVT
ncbi:MAG: hypothetical protein Q8876_05730, partial [Bacillota bacterium]|nr:hypothetical protein [Bacillota bacterium]